MFSKPNFKGHTAFLGPGNQHHRDRNYFEQFVMNLIFPHRLTIEVHFSKIDSFIGSLLDLDKAVDMHRVIGSFREKHYTYAVRFKNKGALDLIRLMYL